MIFTIISHVNHCSEGEEYFAYGPYVREMNLWLRYVDELVVVAPLEKKQRTPIDLAYFLNSNEEKSTIIDFIPVSQFSLTTGKQFVRAIVRIPLICRKIYQGMRKADHIHLRCPGNIGLLGCLVQILFPKKTKTAKYAGNWDPRSKQPWSYRLQRWILRNTFLTRNMTVLVYGEWEDNTKNIKPFFTASYSEKETTEVVKSETTDKLKLAFVGTLAKGKRPLTSLKVVKTLKDRGIPIEMTFCGEGPERAVLEEKIKEWNLDREVKLLGNVNAAIVKNVLQNAHFLIFISRSEGWPKAVAEAMWWGCVPITTAVSCVPQMLGYGERGVLLKDDEKGIVEKVLTVAHNPEKYAAMSRKGMEWSRNYTLERFEKEIAELLR